MNNSHEALQGGSEADVGMVVAYDASASDDRNHGVEETDQMTIVSAKGENAIVNATGEVMNDVISLTNEICGLAGEKQEVNEQIKARAFDIDFASENNFKNVAGSWKEFNNEDCFLKGCKWSPDGLCLLANSNDNILRIFNLPSFLQQGDDSCSQALCNMVPELRMNVGETVYDFDWYPLMTSYDPTTSCFLSTSKDLPIHLWDAFTGQVRCSYLAFNHLDEVVGANSAAFNLDGSRIYCGFNKTIRIFETSRPGRECEELATFVKDSFLTQSGIISCIAFTRQLFALGSFEKSVGIYSQHDADVICMLPGKLGGITQLQFSRDENYIFAGARKNENICCWDLRMPKELLQCFKREVKTNQKMQFDIHWSDRYLFSGNSNGFVSVWDLKEDSTAKSFYAHSDVVNGISSHPYLPLIATTSGQRHFIFARNSSGSEDSDEETIDNSLRIWKYNQT